MWRAPAVFFLHMQGALSTLQAVQFFFLEMPNLGKETAGTQTRWLTHWARTARFMSVCLCSQLFLSLNIVQVSWAWQFRHHFELQQMYIFSFGAKCTKTFTMSECRLILHSSHNSWSCRRGALKGMVDRKHQHCHVLQLSTTATRTHQSCFFVMWQWSSLKNLAYIIRTALINNLGTRKGGTLE